MIFGAGRKHHGLQVRTFLFFNPKKNYLPAFFIYFVGQPDFLIDEVHFEFFFAFPPFFSR